MFYAGAVHSTAFYGHFRLQAFSLGFSFFEFVFRSIRLIRMPVLIALAVAVLAPKLPVLMTSLGVPRRPVRLARLAGHTLARHHGWIVLVSVCLMGLWPFIQPYRWVAPCLVAGGILLGQSRPAGPARAAQGGWHGRPAPCRRRTIPDLGGGPRCSASRASGMPGGLQKTWCAVRRWWC